MSDEETSRATAHELPQRPILALMCVLHGLIVGIFAWVLPWRFDPITHTVAGLVVGAFLTAAVACVLRQSWSVTTLRFAAWTSLGSFLGLVFQIALWSVHLHQLYRGLGWALTGGMGIFLCALGFFLIPLPVFILLEQRARVRPSGGRARAADRGPAALGILLAITLPSAPEAARASDDSARAGTTAAADLPKTPPAVQRMAQAFERSPPPKAAKPGRLNQAAPVVCDSERSVNGAWVVTYLENAKPRSICLQGTESENLTKFSGLLIKNRGAQIKVDLLQEGRPIESTNSLWGALSLRPGVDGICSGARCFLPFQLTTRRAFSSYQPVQSVPEARFGVDLEGLRASLDKDATQSLTVLHSRSFVLTHNSKTQTAKVTPLLRIGEGPSEGSKAELERAKRYAERYILRAQNADGVYRYTLNPFNGKEDYGTVSLPRHAGTTLVLCEHGGKNSSVKDAVSRAVAVFASGYQTLSGNSGPTIGYIHRGKRNPSLGQTALPLIALHECARHEHTAPSEMTGALARFVLKLQRENGSFFPHYDLKTNRPAGEGEAIFAAGQAIYALILTEAELTTGGKKDAALLREVRPAIDRAMAYYAGPYWKNAPAAFFYLEENWHCLAARAALSTRRNSAYEKFCLDYVTFKRRFIQDDDLMGFRGGLTLSPMFTPHSTATSGFGEATAAALALAKARGESRPDLASALHDSLKYLVQIQLTPTTCFACQHPDTLGGFTESPVTGDVRIDFVQHAWAAMAYGQEVLGI